MAKRNMDDGYRGSGLVQASDECERYRFSHDGKTVYPSSFLGLPFPRSGDRVQFQLKPTGSAEGVFLWAEVKSWGSKEPCAFVGRVENPESIPRHMRAEMDLRFFYFQDQMEEENRGKDVKATPLNLTIPADAIIRLKPKNTRSTKSNPSPGTLPPKGAEMLEAVYLKSVGQHPPSRASQIAWGAVKKHYRKDASGQWVEKNATTKGTSKMAKKNPAKSQRLPKYGEVYRVTSPGGEATLVIRAIFQQRKGDSYHARILKGLGKAEDEKKRGHVLWKDDFYLGDSSPATVMAEAEAAAVRWAGSPKGRKKLGISTKKNPCFPCAVALNPAGTKKAYSAKQKEVWKKTPKDYKAGTLRDGTATVLRMTGKGTSLVPLETISNPCFGLHVHSKDLPALMKNTKHNPAKKPADEAAARELQLYADNTRELYNQKQSIEKNLETKVKRGKYDSKQAPKLWKYWMDEAAKRYHKEFGSGGKWGDMFTVATRELAAQWASEDWEAENLKALKAKYAKEAKSSKKKAQKTRKNPSDSKGVYVEDRGKKIYIVDPYNWGYALRSDRGGLYIFQFGAYGDLRLAIWDTGVESALEHAAEWLSEHAPGVFTDSEDLEEVDGEVVDHTYTEYGYIPSWEWHFTQLYSGPLLRKVLVASVRESVKDDEELDSVDSATYKKALQATRKNPEKRRGDKVKAQKKKGSKAKTKAKAKAKAKTKSNPALGHGGRLGKKDKLVIRAFTERRTADGQELTTDGKRLHGHWMGGRGIAEWKEGKIHFGDLGSKAAEFVQRAVRKEAPRNDLAETKKNPAKGKAKKARKNPTSDQELQFILDGVAESEGVEDGSAIPTLELTQLWEEFDEKTDAALESWLKANKLDEDKLDEMQDADSTYNVYMTLRGEGVGIWDGRWDHILTQPQIEDLTKHLKKKLGKYVDDTGGGKVEDAMREAVWVMAERNPAPRKAPKKKPRKTKKGAKACALPAGPMRAAERNRLPASAFGLPVERKYPLGRMRGSRYVPSAWQAVDAKGRAMQQLQKGNLSGKQYAQIVVKADKVIDGCRDIKKNPCGSGHDWHTGTQGNPARAGADYDKARDLLLSAQNEGSIYAQRQAIEKNLIKKMEKGKYDPAKAPKAWEHWITEGAKVYARYYDEPYHKMFNKATRELAAEMQAAEFQEDYAFEQAHVNPVDIPLVRRAQVGLAELKLKWAERQLKKAKKAGKPAKEIRARIRDANKAKKALEKAKKDLGRSKEKAKAKKLQRSSQVPAKRSRVHAPVALRPYVHQGVRPDWLGETSFHDVALSSRAKSPVDETYRSLKKVFGKPSGDEVSSKPRAEKDEYGETYYDFGTYVNEYVFVWEDGLQGTVYFRRDDDSVLTGEWNIGARSKADAEEIKRRLQSLLREKRTAAKKSAASKKVKKVTKKKATKKKAAKKKVTKKKTSRKVAKRNPSKSYGSANKKYGTKKKAAKKKARKTRSNPTTMSVAAIIGSVSR